MHSIIKTIWILVLCFVSVNLFAQARLTIENKSQREMIVKIMKGISKGNLHKTIHIRPYSNGTVYFSESGQYFCKTKAVLRDKKPVYQKGQPFKVINDHTGYSVMTLTFSIKESNIPQITGGKTISKSEFDQN